MECAAVSRNAVATRRGSARFLEDRRAGLERYLNRLAFHPVASKCEVLHFFADCTSICGSHSGAEHLFDIARRPALQSLMDKAPELPLPQTRATGQHSTLLQAGCGMTADI
eukprot:1160874-Pelagomonas_calceolata.AAC.12